MPDETNGVNNVVSCYKEAVQYLALPLLCHCLPYYYETCGTAMNFVFFRPGKTNLNCEYTTYVTGQLR